MPTRKQRRRRQKELRHEWEEVYLDAEGRELPPEEVEELLPQAAGANGREHRGAKTAAPAKGRAASRTRSMREVKPPSWRRVFKRAAIFAPLMYLFIAFTGRNLSATQEVFTTVWLLLIFIPFSYLMDSFTYRLWKKRMAKAGPAVKRR
jgi:hypothetical protein